MTPPLFADLATARGEGRLARLMTSQVPIGRWHEIIGDPTLGDAILDRIIHCSHRIELKGESLRKRQAMAVAESLTAGKEKRDLFNRQW